MELLETERGAVAIITGQEVRLEGEEEDRIAIALEDWNAILEAAGLPPYVWPEDLAADPETVR